RGDVPVLQLAEHDARECVRTDALPRDLPLRELPAAVRAVQSRLRSGTPPASPALRAAGCATLARTMAIDSDEIRSRADELLDAGAHDPLDTMRHSAAHV